MLVMKSPSVNRFNINVGGIDIVRGDADYSAAYKKEDMTMPWQTDRVDDPATFHANPYVSRLNFGEI